MKIEDTEVKALIKKAAETVHAIEAQQFSQAALNAANALVLIANANKTFL